MTEKWDYLVSDEKLEDLIKNYCVDFTTNAKNGLYGPITGRDKEINDCILILLQKGRKNVCFLAPAGVGKTAAVVGLAQQIVAEKVPDYLKDARVIEVDLSRMASGTSSRAEFQDRFLPLCKGVSERYHNPDLPRIILFLDEIHQIMPNCEGSSYAGLSDTMKPYLTAGDLLVIGATTLDEFRMYVAQDPAMDRRFQKVFLKVPNIQETYAIMKALRPGLEKHHKLTVTNEDLMLIVYLTEEHMRRRNQPDKSIITADAAMAYHVMYQGINQELSKDSIYYMIARETGLNAKAMHDEKLIQEIREEVAVLEGEIVQKKEKDEAYDPSLKVKDVDMDKDYQAELASEQEKAEKEIAESKKKLDEKFANAGINDGDSA
ncbi:MAG: AAA family ATPase [Alphaproteobacteria bacterium]|nr:AAA family ATPase [Alphaproteobacteria bacterium]